jgi:Ala-tRNA(Pro) deacylase
MTVALTLQEILENNGIDYEVVPHAYSHTATEAAEAAHVPREKVAKCVMLDDGKGFVMAVVPSTHRVDLRVVGRFLGRHVQLASEQKLNELLYDCEVGAVPPIAGAYGIRMVVDHSLLGVEDIYFEAGDHEDLVHLSGAGFSTLVADADADTVPICYRS